MDFLPVSLNVSNQPILIVGGGKVALQKIKSLSQFNCSITVISLDVLPDIEQIEEIEVILKPIEDRDLNKYRIVYAATDDRCVNAFVRDEGMKRGCLVNVVDDPMSGHFISPAIFVEDEMTVAVGSDGKNLKRSIRWRNAIKEFFTNGGGSGI